MICLGIRLSIKSLQVPCNKGLLIKISYDGLIQWNRHYIYCMLSNDFLIFVFQTFKMDTIEQRDQERESISTFFDLFIFTIIPLVIFKGKSRFNPVRFFTELILYVLGYVSIVILNRDKSN